jgi:hypothetical protein
MDVNFYAPRHGHSVCDGHFGALKKVRTTVPAISLQKDRAHLSIYKQKNLQRIRSKFADDIVKTVDQIEDAARECVHALVVLQPSHNCFTDAATRGLSNSTRKKSHLSTIFASRGWMGSQSTFPSSPTLQETRRSARSSLTARTFTP